MQTTKQQILVLLKRAGSITVEQAAGALAVASMTARQHLTNLERDGLIVAEKAKRATGRPHFLYSLTPKGEEMFPRRYDLLAQVMLDEIGCLEPGDVDGLNAEAKRSLLIRRTADRLADRYRLQVEGRTLEERVPAVTEILQLIGGFAEWYSVDDGYEIRDYNCVFAKLTGPEASGCEWHVRLLTQLLKWPVRHELFVEGRVQCCRYLIDTEAAGKLGEGTPANA
ncbi:MAG: helix-turn-helix transcriptional regulator [Dehalococcoidia bacterium]